MMHYATANMAWQLYPFWERYLCTGDQVFLRERLYPLLRPMADFYEDFLVSKDKDGKFIFAGSTSPENAPIMDDYPRADSGEPWSVKTVISNYDISGARRCLLWCIEMCEALKVDLEHIPKWRSILDDLPPYLVNSHGALSEWAWPPFVEHQNYEHRHSSGLMCAWPYREITPETNMTLWLAVKEFHRRKDLSYYPGGGCSGWMTAAHGIVHAMLIAATLNEGAFIADKIVLFVNRGFYYTSLASSHFEKHQMFCVDIVHTMPTILVESVVGSDRGILELLPAVPTGLTTGTLRGVLGRSQFRLIELKWDLSSGHVSAVIDSKVAQKLKVINRLGITGFETKVPFTVDSGIQRTVDLPAGETTITVTFPVAAAD
jgi:hypothetical protein